MIHFGEYLKDYLDQENISQSEFAIKLGVTQKHINEIINGKTNMSVELIGNIEKLTNISAEFIIRIESKNKLYKTLMNKFKTEEKLKEKVDDFHLNEISKEKKWILFKDKTNVFQIASDLLSFLGIANFDVLEEQKKNYLFKKTGDDLNKISLWIARCNQLAVKQEVKGYIPDKFDGLIEVVKKHSLKEGLDIEGITKILNSFGIYLVVEKALSGTKIRGVFSVKKDKPAIYLTSNYAAKDSFYFELFHELGHCKRDYNSGKKNIIADGNPESEEKADVFALEAMINNDIVKDIVNSYNDEKQLLKISKDNKIPMSFIVGRLAKQEIIKYNGSLYNKYRNN